MDEIKTKMEKPLVVFLDGPSGVGKSTLGNALAAAYGFRYADADAFKRMFSSKRSRIRTEIGEKLATVYAEELIARGMSLIIEAIPDNLLTALDKVLDEKGYQRIKLSLVAPVEQCIENDRQRGIHSHGEAVIREVYEKLLSTDGFVINVAGRSKKDVFRIASAYIDAEIVRLDAHR